VNVYVDNPLVYKRLKTHEVQIGDLLMGAQHPIRVQSMTTTDTMDTNATVTQSIRMIEAGCELVRITAPSINEARNLEQIKSKLRSKGYNTPLCADIHFTPNAAEYAARIVEKVRVNPGNYADKKKFEQIEYTDITYNAELERIYDRFLPLVKICKTYGTAMRIGTNHGSLSDRILSRYGDTPKGMVESALEFIRICESEQYYNLVISMKASNTQVMVQAYRMLVAEMRKTERSYPLHLGVTEAGDGEDGRIKSAVGIGTLLEDGIGDTVRVSLTEDPEFEIPVARALINRYATKRSSAVNIAYNKDLNYNPFAYERQQSCKIQHIGLNQPPIVISELSENKEIKPANFYAAGYSYSIQSDKWHIADQAADFIYIGNADFSFEIPGTLGIIQNLSQWIKNSHRERFYPLFSLKQFLEYKAIDAIQIGFVVCKSFEDWMEFLKLKKYHKSIVAVLESSEMASVYFWRQMLFEMEKNTEMPNVIFKKAYVESNPELLSINAAVDLGALLIDGFGDGIWISASNISLADRCSISFGILQATRTRISKTEYISCPSCGRTLFDLQETTQKIRARTHHLKGIKIGIMGCIVNGPGEMADADYGYVGTGTDKISLYKGQELVKKNIQAQTAVDALIELIQQHGDWVEPPKTV
jgi:(E)-4-hydroxy-3-methylbut-2-enyl-diphosphate synthase